MSDLSFRLRAVPAWISTQDGALARYMTERAKGKPAAQAGAIARCEGWHLKGIGLGWHRPGQPAGLTATRDRDVWGCDKSNPTPFRSEQPAYLRGYPDEYEGEEYSGDTYRPVVARVGTGKRAGWVAGYLHGDEWCGWDVNTVFENGEDPPEDALRHAHDLACHAAEREAEYQEGWRDGNQAREAWRVGMADALDKARAAKTMKQARRKAVETAWAMREGVRLGVVPPGEVARLRGLARQAWARVLELAEEAQDKREETWGAWVKQCPVRLCLCRGRMVVRPDYRADPYDCGFYDGAEG